MSSTLTGRTGVTINKGALDRLLRQRNGPVVLHVANETRRALASARREAPVGSGLSGSGKPKTRPHLRDSLDMEMVRTSTGWTGRIVCDAEHAASVINGAVSHPISPVDAVRLAFFWEKKGRWFVGAPGQSVNHPGNDPNNFLARGMERVGLRPNRPTSR